MLSLDVAHLVRSFVYSAREPYFDLSLAQATTLQSAETAFFAHENVVNYPAEYYSNQRAPLRLFGLAAYTFVLLIGEGLLVRSSQLHVMHV
jgi:hypothetical protein